MRCSAASRRTTSARCFVFASSSFACSFSRSSWRRTELVGRRRWRQRFWRSPCRSRSRDRSENWPTRWTAWRRPRGRRLSQVAEHLQGTGPKEIVQLASSFHRLLDCLTSRPVGRWPRSRAACQPHLGRISLSVAHELRNPLSGIKMNMRVLRDQPGLRDDPGVEAILREIDRMGLYLEELMSLSPGSDSCPRSPELVPMKLSELADSVLTILSGRCRHAKVVVQRSFPADEPAAGGGQPNPPGDDEPHDERRRGHAGRWNHDSGNPAAAAGLPRFCVGDTGNGVQDNGEDIFEAFASNKPNGVGLGLYICKQIVVASHWANRLRQQRGRARSSGLNYPRRMTPVSAPPECRAMEPRYEPFSQVGSGDRRRGLHLPRLPAVLRGPRLDGPGGRLGGRGPGGWPGCGPTWSSWTSDCRTAAAWTCSTIWPATRRTLSSSRPTAVSIRSSGLSRARPTTTSSSRWTWTEHWPWRHES